MAKTKKIMFGISVAAASLGLVGCGTDESARPPVPTDKECRDWEWSEIEGAWRCDDTSSRHYGGFFYAGRYFQNSKSLNANQSYQSYKNSSSFKSSGFGSGTSSFGG